MNITEIENKLKEAIRPVLLELTEPEILRRVGVNFDMDSDGVITTTHWHAFPVEGTSVFADHLSDLERQCSNVEARRLEQIKSLEAQLLKLKSK